MPTISQHPVSDNRETQVTNIDLSLLTRVKSIPVLPAGSLEMIQKLSDTTLPFDELAASLENFPTIVARLMSLANSPWSSPVSPVTSLDSTVARLGLDVVRSVGIAILISTPFDIRRCPGFDEQRYWCTALLAAHVAAKIAVLTPPAAGILPPTARAAGLMHSLGLLWLADVMPRETDRALSIAAEDPTISVNQALLSSCGVSYSHAGAALSKAWHIPPPVSVAMAYHWPVTPDTADETCVNIVRLVTAMIGTLYCEITPVVESRYYADLGIDDETYNRTYDDLVKMFPVMQELAQTLFQRKNQPLD